MRKSSRSKTRVRMQMQTGVLAKTRSQPQTGVECHGKSTVFRNVALLTINGPGRLCALGRRELSAWLRHQAREVAKNADAYTRGRFRASFTTYSEGK